MIAVFHFFSTLPNYANQAPVAMSGGFNIESIGNILNTVSSSAVKDLVDAGVARQLITQKDIDALGLLGLSDQKARIPESAYRSLWLLLDERSGNPDLGLEIGSQINPEAKGLLASWVSQCATLEEAFEVFSRHISLMNPAESWTLSKVGERVELGFSWEGEERYPSMAVDRSLSALLSWGAMLSGQPLLPCRARLAYSEVGGSELRHQIYGSRLDYGADAYVITLEAKALELPVSSANSYLHSVLQGEAKQALRSLQRQMTIKSRVQAMIDEHLEYSPLGIDWVAERLGMSRQTLYRQLKAEQTDFKHLLTERRMEKAIALLNRGDMSVYAISTALGYQDTSSFYKAFQRWFGQTVSDYRNQL